MSNTITNGAVLSKWQRVVQAHQDYRSVMQEFLADGETRVDALKKALRGPDRDLGLAACAALDLEDKKELFSEWVHLARSAHGPFQIAWNIILSLPRDWVVQHITRESDAILTQEEYDDYWMFLQLYKKLDPVLTHALAERALRHSDPEIRELGQDYSQA